MENNNKFTPGEWEFLKPKSHLVVQASGLTICVIGSNIINWSTSEIMEAEANAKLIASAPCMYAALIEAQKLIKIARTYMPKSIKNSDKFSFENISANVIQKAIDKATK